MRDARPAPTPATSSRAPRPRTCRLCSHQPPDCDDARPYRAGQAARYGRRGDRMTRREFITLVGGAAAAWPLAARAQQQLSKIPRVGIIDPTAQWAPFRQGLRELGYIEGRNIAIEFRSAEAG